MSIESKFGFIGHCTEGTSDKIWGYFFRPTPDNPYSAYRTSYRSNDGRNVVIFWARRGKGMQFKPDTYSYVLERLQESKIDPRKSYRSITESKLMDIWPTFIEEAESKLMWDILSGKVK